MSRRIHLVGIGGAGLSAIARVLLERGEIVSGSDRQVSNFAQALERDGVTVVYEHAPANIEGAELVIASSAVPPDNPELVAARQAGIPVLGREAFLGELTSGYHTIAVAGTHGKTTTTGLIAWLLSKADLDPSYVVGGVLTNLGRNAHAGSGPHFVIEADEYDRAFLGLNPDLAVITNIEHDHPDCFPTEADVLAAFNAFVERVREKILVCGDDPHAAALERAGLQRASYGLGRQNDWRAEDVRPNVAGGSDFLLTQNGRVLGLMRTRLPGEHNVRNAVAGLAVALEMGVPLSAARQSLTEYSGSARRFELLGQEAGITVIDDYAHHPTEIRATLAAARARYPQAQVWALFQPHTYSRTRALIAPLAQAFGDADRVLVSEVFAAREKVDPAFGGRQVAARLEHPAVEFVPDFEAALDILRREMKPGSVLVTLSAGDANEVGKRLLADLAKHGEE
jgi:UDP-N-acetylmuramate--alanine ligase